MELASMTAEKSRSSHSDLREQIRKLLHQRPNQPFSVNEIRLSFKGKDPALLSNQLLLLRNQGHVEMIKRGFWRASNSLADARIKEAQEHLASLPQIVQQSTQSAMGAAQHITAVIPVEVKWVKLVEMHLASIKKRMKSTIPAIEIFTEDDRNMIDFLLAEASASARAYLTRQAEGATK